MTKRFIIASVAALLATAPAMADTMRGQESPANVHGAVTTSVKVDFSDLNVTSLAGAKVLLGRINAASSKVCGPAPAPMELSSRADWSTCMADAASRAVDTLGNPLVTDLFEQKNPAIVIARGN
ncbi:MAG: UrcA family protein [Alphaproteobacteria bacterium]